MGQITLPPSGKVYVDAQIIIYSTNQHPTYLPLCMSVWKASGNVLVVSSELTLLETLVAPLREKDADLAQTRKDLWLQGNARLLPITKEILLLAAELRASIPSLKSPDAIHAATCFYHSCSLFVTNDAAFRRIPNLPLVLLDDLLDSP